jgi:uncharacterized protein YndB with AHSA1/START domain
MPVTDVRKDFDALTMTLVAEFDAPVESIWEAWEDPRLLGRWWGPRKHTATFTDHTLTPGSLTSYYFTGPDGETSKGWWRIEEVDKPHRLSIRDADAEGLAAEGAPVPTTDEVLQRMVVTLTDIGDGRTSMEVESHFSERPGMESYVEGGYEQGSREIIENLEEVLATETRTRAPS